MPTPTADPQNFGSLLATRRRLLGLSQQTVATATGIHQTKLCQLENGGGKYLLVPEKLEKLAGALSLTQAELLRAFGYQVDAS